MNKLFLRFIWNFLESKILMRLKDHFGKAYGANRSDNSIFTAIELAVDLSFFSSIT